MRGETSVLESEKAKVLRGSNTLVHVVVMTMAVIDKGEHRGGRVEGGGQHEATVEAMAEAPRAVATTHAATMARLDGAATDAKQPFAGGGAELGGPRVKEADGGEKIAVRASTHAIRDLLTTGEVKGTLEVGGGRARGGSLLVEEGECLKHDVRATLRLTKLKGNVRLGRYRVGVDDWLPADTYVGSGRGTGENGSVKVGGERCRGEDGGGGDSSSGGGENGRSGSSGRSSGGSGVEEEARRGATHRCSSVRGGGHSKGRNRQRLAEMRGEGGSRGGGLRGPIDSHGREGGCNGSSGRGDAGGGNVQVARVVGGREGGTHAGGMQMGDGSGGGGGGGVREAAFVAEGASSGSVTRLNRCLPKRNGTSRGSLDDGSGGGCGGGKGVGRRGESGGGSGHGVGEGAGDSAELTA
jgi:hypothetical protein